MTAPADARRAQALCLAAVVEAAVLVDQLARNGSAPVDSMQALTESLFRFEWQAVEDVYGGVANLRRGLGILESVLEQFSDARQPQLLRYVLALLHLGRRLANDTQRLSDIRVRLEHANRKAMHFSTQFDEIATSIAAIYQDLISTYNYRILVSGNAAYLQDARISARIRTLLLAGLRAAVLWRFVGGSRRGILFGRAALLEACRNLAAAV